MGEIAGVILKHRYLDDLVEDDASGVQLSM